MAGLNAQRKEGEGEGGPYASALYGFDTCLVVKKADRVAPKLE